MKKNFLLTLVLLAIALFTVQPTVAQTEAELAVTGLLNRIGGDGAADRFEIVIDESLNTNDKDVFVIEDGNGKPRIKGSNQLAVATGINWYLNHVAHINLTWNKLSTDLVSATLPLPGETVTKECAADLRYYLNYCTFSYTSALWTEERWMQEIDWMALHGINMPLMLVGLDCVWYDLYTKAEYGYNYTAEEISKHIAGPAFQAWWAMINCEGHGGPNPAWWYERSRALATNMLARMRSFGMEPVLPGFCGEVPSSLQAKLSNDSEINTGGDWQGFSAPGLMGHLSSNWETLAKNYYDALEGVMGTSKYYSMDPFHEEATGLTGNSASDLTGYFQSCYAQMKANVGEGVVWVAQDWGSNPRNAMLTGLNKGELIVLDLFAEADPHYSGGYNGHDYIYCMLHNFGGRVGLHGRFNKTMDGYYAALEARGDEMVGIGATPEGVENNPMLYDMLFELPWRETAPDKTEWVNNYTVSRYGEENAIVQKAYSRLMQSVYNCTTGQQGTSEPIICAIPSLTATKVSTWASSAVDYEHEIVIAAADEMLSQVSEFDALNDNFNYDLLDIVRQALTNYALDMLAQLNSDYNANGYDATFSARKDHYLALIEDIDALLGTHQKFRLGNWAEMARAIVTETAAVNNGAGESDADWLEYDNLRRQITTWATFWSSLRDYSNREWNGLVKDYYLERWKIFFDALENGTTGNLNNNYWYNYGNTYVYDDTKTYSAAPEGDTKTVARNSFDKYFLIDTDDEGNKVYFSRHIEQSKAAAEYVKYAYRGGDFTFTIPDGTTATFSIDANNDGVFGDGETVSSNTFTIPEDAATTTVKALIVLSDNTEISFYVFLADLIEEARTVTVLAGDNGSVAIEGTTESSITNSEYVTMTATGSSGYEFSHWVQVAGDGVETEVSRENPFTYLGKAEATFKAYFIENIWGVPSEDWGDSGDITTKQYLTSITCTQEGNTTEIYSASEATEKLFVPVATIINAAKGSQFAINWQGDGNMKYCYLSAYIDFNKDGDFEDDGELLMVKGTLGSENTAVETGPLTILLPLDMPIGITHIRLRFDGAWKSGYDATTKAFPAANIINRRCYEIVLNVTEYAAGNSHIVITSNNEEWGTVRNITGVTGEDINVPSGTEICMEAFPNDGYEFVHWLDKYGRIVSTDASFYYTPCESGEFTAVFKKIAQETVVIDGWEFRIRTQPGTPVTTKLANGVKPEDGKTYYIYAYPKQGSTDVYTARYLYDNSGTLATNTVVGATGYLWTCIKNNDTYSFLNETGRYLANSSSSNCYLSVGATAAAYTFEAPSYEGLTIYNPSSPGGKYMVTNAAGTSFNRYSAKANDGSWSSDYVFVEYSVPTDVVLTEVLAVGNNDLIIPETVIVDDVECAIVGFDNNLFTGNTELWSITLPETMQFISSNVVANTSLEGGITPSTGSDDLDSNKSQVIDLGYTLENNKVWTLDITFETEGKNSLYNQWGTILLSGGDNASNNQWLYLSANGNGYLRVPGFSSLYNDSNDANNYFYNLTNGKISTFKVSIANQGDGTAIVTVTNSNGESLSSSAVSFSPNGVSKLSSYITTGVNITELKITESAYPDPFAGCSNLDKISIDGTCENYYVKDSDGGLYNSGDVLISLPAGKEKGADRRALAALIEDMQELTAEVGTFDPVGKSTKIALQTTTMGTAGYIWSNADHNQYNPTSTDGGGIAHLVDGIKGDANNFFHTVYSNDPGTEYHYIEVDLGENNTRKDFYFVSTTRNGSWDFANVPDQITVMVSDEEDVDFVDIQTFSNLPQGKNSTYTSETYSTQKAYRYMRFKVVAENKYWHMAEFELYKKTSSADVFPVFDGTELTDDFAAARYDVLVDAINTYDYGTTAAEMQAAVSALQTAYDELLEKFNTVLPFRLTTDEEHPVLYNIFIKRTADVTLLEYDEATKQIAVKDKAANNSWQAWYFMVGENGVIIKPFNAEGKMLGANDTSNGAGKVLAAEEDEMTYNEWTIVKRGDEGYFNITTNGAYFSHFGGNANKMGFWDGDGNESKTQTDGGSLFKFVDAEFENDNARYYQLNDFMALCPDGTNIYGGTSIGLYTGGAEYREAYVSAAPLKAAGNTSDATECYVAYKALRPAAKDLSYNAPDPNKAYYIVSASTNDNTQYCQGKYVYSPNSSVTRTRGNYTGTHNHTNLIFDAFTDITNKALAAFQFEETGERGKYKMKSLNSGLYVKSFTGTHLGAASEAAVVTVAAYADGQVTLKIGNNSPMHAQNDYGVIVQWGAAAGNASLWTIDEVADVSDFNYTLAVPTSGVTTLCLPYNVVLPAGVTAYTVKSGDILPALLNDGYYYEELVQVAASGEKLAKGTAVIIKAAAGNYTFTATMDNTDAVTAESSALTGTYYVTNVNSSDETKRYNVGVEDSEVLFTAITADTAFQPYSSWLETAADAERITVKEEPQDIEIVDGAVYRIHGRLSNGTLRTLYNNGSNNRIAWTTDDKNDASTLFIAQAGADGKFKLVSALGNGIWNQNAQLGETGVELTFSAGSVNGATMIVGNSNRRFNVYGSGTGGNVDYYSNCNAEVGRYVTESESTNFVLELVDDATLANYSLKMKKSYEWSTLYLPYAVKVPAGIEAYIATTGPVEVGVENVIDLIEVENVVPANTAVILKRASTVAAETFNFVYAKDAETPNVDGNIFAGRITEGYIGGTGMASKNFYILFRGDAGERLYWIYKEYDSNGNQIAHDDNGYIKCAANKAYLALDADANNASSYSFRFSGTTGIEEVKGEYGNVNAVYDLQGRKLTEITEPGVYIIDGKKVLVK